MLHQRVLRDRRPIEAGRDDERTFRAGGGCALDLLDRIACTLLTGANDERERFRDRFSRRLDYLHVFSLIEVDALACRAEHDIADHARVVPFRKVAGECFSVKVFAGSEWSRDWEQDPAEIDCHEPVVFARLIRTRDYNQRLSQEQFGSLLNLDLRARSHFSFSPRFRNASVCHQEDSNRFGKRDVATLGCATNLWVASNTPNGSWGIVQASLQRGYARSIRIPSTAVGGYVQIQPMLDRWDYLETHASGPLTTLNRSGSFTNYLFPRSSRLDLNNPPTSVGGIYDMTSGFCRRSGLNLPPTAVGGILSCPQICRTP